MTIRVNTYTTALLLIGLGAAASLRAQVPPPQPTNAPPSAAVIFPLERTAYFIGETVPLALTGASECRFEAVGIGGRTVLYQGKPGALWLDTSRLAPGDYVLEVNGTKVADRFTLTSPLRQSAGSLQDEATPSEKLTSDETTRIFQESGLSACVTLGASDLGRAPYLDTLARTGALLLVNPDTRPTSFFPVGNNAGCMT